MPEVPDGEADMTARIITFRPRAIEPIRVSAPAPASASLCVMLWLFAPAVWAGAFYAFWFR